MEFINVGSAYIKGWVGGASCGWVVAKAKTKKQDDTNSRVYSGHDGHMYPQRANTPLQGLHRYALTVGAISGRTTKLEPSIGIISPVVDLHGWLKHPGKAD